MTASPPSRQTSRPRSSPEDESGSRQPRGPARSGSELLRSPPNCGCSICVRRIVPAVVLPDTRNRIGHPAKLGAPGRPAAALLVSQQKFRDHEADAADRYTRTERSAPLPVGAWRCR
jgi:hypothetical protein